MPLIRRLPKRGFNNAAFKTSYGLVNLPISNSSKMVLQVDGALCAKRDWSMEVRRVEDSWTR